MKTVLHWLKAHWKLCLWVVAVLASLASLFLFLRADCETIDTLSSQLAAERWETEDKPYAMASAFLSESSSVPSTSVDEIRLSVENALTTAGISSDDHPWLYAFSRTEQAALQNGIASTNVEITLVTGDYFTIHPLNIRKGWYLSETEVMRDRIILDRHTAWDLFYSDNVVGQYLEWNGQRYMVAAVVDTEPGTYNDMAAGDIRRAWAFADSPAVDSSQGYTCVELVLPQPVDGFALSALQTVLGDYLIGCYAVIDNTNRFSLANRWSALRTISTRWLDFQGIDYPYYENAAKLVENHLALQLIPEGILLLFPVVSVLIWLWMLNRRRTWGLHSIKETVERMEERNRRKK